jgi:uncharacterized protein
VNSETCVVVFAKAPIAGFAKTRLIPALGAQGAANLALGLLQLALQNAMDSHPKSVELCVTPDPNYPVFIKLAQQHAIDVTQQAQGNLGERMHHAFLRVLNNYPTAILMGTDAPGLTACLIEQAQSALLTHDAVFVPALDGGYALVGLCRPCPELFDNIPWSTAGVMEQTRIRAIHAGLSWHELPAVGDIDEPDDLIYLPPTFTLEK